MQRRCISAMLSEQPPWLDRWFSLRMSLKAHRLSLRARLRAGDLTLLRRGTWARDAILLFCTIRNEIERIDWFLRHYRGLGVDHFIFIDNASTDGTGELLRAQPDATLYTTAASYKAARFGQDWITALMDRHGHRHWCLVVDADELLIYPHWPARPLPALTAWLTREDLPVLPALLLELYPKGALGAAACPPGADPLAVLEWFDAGNYTIRHKPLLDTLLIQGGPRARMFFTQTPERAPTLTKLPLIRWRRGYAWANSTHSILPRGLNRVYSRDGGEGISGALLHTKFLPTIRKKSAIEKQRGEHFGNAPIFDAYYDALAAGPRLWTPASTRFEGWQQLEELGLMSRGGWA